MINGFLNVLKPPDMTAHDVVAVLRRILKTRRIGHAGTLDPAAAGVLPVAVGQATRLLQFLRHDKEYFGEVLFGVSTDTLDSTGEIIEKRGMKLDSSSIEEILPLFRGEIEQRVPMVSAVQIDGKRLYALARAGVEMERPVRKAEIYSLELLRFFESEFPRALFKVHCGGGTYIRSLAEEMGSALGGFACLSFLLRTMACGFPLSEALTLEEIKEKAEESSRIDFLLPCEEALLHLEELILEGGEMARFLHGQILPNPGLKGNVRVMGEKNLLGIALAEGENLKPRVVFNEENA
ncbi:MAG TPA: tRNA pseudouridine(55) synthase TruB [Chroococcales cyanobacterium]|jgi:tRNA pseudouridine55 synthase